MKKTKNRRKKNRSSSISFVFFALLFCPVFAVQFADSSI